MYYSLSMSLKYYVLNQDFGLNVYYTFLIEQPCSIKNDARHSLSSEIITLVSLLRRTLSIREISLRGHLEQKFYLIETS